MFRVLVSAVLLISYALFAQSPQATISGSVRDPQGSVVVNAEVRATAVATGVAANVTTNESGFYSLRNLPIGEYTVEVTHTGFRGYQRRGIQLSTGQSLELDIALEVGQVSETVSVTASAQMLETRTSDVSQLVETKTVEDVPLGDRRTMNLINLTPAAVFVNYDSGSKPNFSLAGGRTQSQSFFIDGGTGQNMRLGIGQIDIDPPVETVAEVKVLANNYSAEYGGSAGGVIIATTKSGTNQLRGTLFEYLRNEKLDAANFFAPIQNGEKVRAPLRYNVFGGTVGGPVVLPKIYNGKDKTFFFFAYEGSRRRDGFVRTFTVPTQLERMGDFSQTRSANGAL
ncbi:MAG TPA: carboxypeptidase-like regulatory domain-containing protein, partial [Bryobacteraceae bacterium]|nr:carboxypeptidase-like regulatory domain-containing protein [Bryobacteraceae bacterium]